MSRTTTSRGTTRTTTLVTRGATARGERGERPGRGVGQLLADFGHELPAAPPAPAIEEEARLFRHVPRRGVPRRGRGWAPASAPVSAWRMTSDQAPVLWPFITSPGLPPTGAQMGIDQLAGGSFYVDPLGWVLRDDVPVTNPNMFVFGKPGRGKSGTTKAFCLRMMDFGYRVLIVGDPKDEYEKLCRAFGVEPFVIGHGLPARINPLAIGPLSQGWDRLDAAAAQGRAAIVFGRWLTLVRGLVGSQRIGEAPRPVRALRRGRRQDRPGDPDRVRGRSDADAGGHHPPAVAAAEQPHRRPGRRPAGTQRPALPGRAPGCCATRSGSWSPGLWPACSTTTPPSTSTGAPRSSRCPCPGWNPSATTRSGSP